jgi:hypothetical protein
VDAEDDSDADDDEEEDEDDEEDDDVESSSSPSLMATALARVAKYKLKFSTGNIEFLYF